MSEVLPLFERLGAYVLTWSWQIAVLVLCTWIAVSMDRRHRPVLRHRLWVLTLSFGLILPWIAEEVAALSWTRQVRQVLMTPVAAPSTSKILDSGKAFVAPPTSTEKAHAIDLLDAEITPSRWSVSQATLLQAIGLLWVAGAGIGAFRRMRGYWRLRRIASDARRSSADADGATPPILLSADVRSPMLYGWLRPVILLPENVSSWSTPEERETMIRHESVHAARNDHWISAFETLVRTVFFFHPVVRWTFRQVDIERELACDEEVLRRGIEPAVYAEAILKVAEYAVAGRVTCGVYFAATANLDHRIDMLFRTPARVGRSMVLLLPVFLLAVPTLALGFWQARVETLAPIEFSIEVNPPGLLPEEILVPAPKPLPVAAAVPVAEPAQDPPIAPATPQAPSRSDVAFMKVTDGTTMTNITLGIPHSGLVFKEEVLANSRMGRKASGRVSGQVFDLTGIPVRRFEDQFEIVTLAQTFNPGATSAYQQTVYLQPGLYRLFVATSDANGGNVNTIDRRLLVPAFPANTLSAGSLVLADVVELVPTVQNSPSSFRIGNARVRPNVSEFRRDQNLNVFQQVYVADGQAGSPLPLRMEILITLDGREVQRTTEQIQRSEAAAITRSIPLTDFVPGSYTVQTTYTDTASGESVISTAQFGVR